MRCFLNGKRRRKQAVGPREGERERERARERENERERGVLLNFKFWEPEQEGSLSNEDK